MAKRDEVLKKAAALRKIGLSETEIAEVLADDDRIDHNEKLFELPDELKLGAKKARQAERKVPTKPIQREKKVNNEKLFIIDLLKAALAEHIDGDFDISNPEREFSFTRNGMRYRITLAMPRK